jgi:hypothetical protein
MLNPVIHELNITVYCPSNKEFNSNQILSLLKSSKIILESRPNQQFFSTSLKCKIEDIILGHLDLNETSLIRKHLESDYYIDSNINILNFNFNTIENVNTISAKIIFRFNRDLFKKNLHENWKILSEQTIKEKNEIDQKKLFNQNQKLLGHVSSKYGKFDQEYLLNKYNMYLIGTGSFHDDIWDDSKLIIEIFWGSTDPPEKSKSQGSGVTIWLASNDTNLVNKIKKLDPEKSVFSFPSGYLRTESLQSKAIRKYFRPIFEDLEINAGFGYSAHYYFNEFSVIEYLKNKEYRLKK